MIVRDVGSERSRHRSTSQEERERAIAKANQELQASTQEKAAKYKAYNDYMNRNVDDIDFMTYDAAAAKAQKDALWHEYQLAVEKEKVARKNLLAAKYDTLSTDQLQTAAAESQDEEESAYIAKVQNNRVKEQRQRDLEIMSSVADPESVLYDPGFQEKNGYHSTKLTDGSKGESDTGYADIDYEFINGNGDISELIVGKERNYYKINEEERRIYNYWYNYDREHGTNTAQQYLDLLQETLNARDSADDYAKIEGKPVQELMYGVWAGLGKYGRNTNNWYLKSGEYIPMSSTEMTAQRAYEGLADVGFQINGKSLGQIGYSYIEDKAYNAPGDLASKLAGPDEKVVGKIIKGVFSAPATSGEHYREMINRGYTNEQATTYGKKQVVGSIVAGVAKDLAGDAVGKVWKNVFTDGGMRKLGDILSDADWLGITQWIENGVQSAFETPPKNTDSGNLQTAGKAAITNKALDKIVNRERVRFTEVSPDLRKAMQESLEDPAVRQQMEAEGTFTKEQLDSFAAEMKAVDPSKDDVGTYIGDYLYGENGYAINKHYLQPLVEQAIRDRGKYINDQTAKAIFERYMPRSMLGR